MKEERNEFLGLLCNLYIVALLVALPLYTGEGYWQLGDTKYMLFRNVSVLCLGCWLALGIPMRIYAAVKRTGQAGRLRDRISFNWLDFAVACYGMCVLVSALCSSYRHLAWAGYEGWYMGALSQLLFVGTYFFVSRRYDGEKWPLYLAVAALFLVTMFGLLHRLGIDPLGLLKGWNSGDWEYSHMLSTLGNINWLCGYYSVATAFAIGYFLKENRRWLQVVLYLISVLTFVLLGVQGSQGGLLILAVCVAVCVLAGWRKKVILQKVCLLLAGAFFCMPVMELLMKLRGDKAAIVRDGNIFSHVRWYSWVIGGGFCLLFYFLFDKIIKLGPGNRSGNRAGKFAGSVPGKKKDKRRGIATGILLTAGVVLGIYLLCRMAVARVDDGFGSGRGFLWRIAIQNVEEADIKDKLIGAGPDCYAEKVYNRLAVGTDVWKGEHWEGAVFTNAHNEFLNSLCNVGILGTFSYVAIFLTTLWVCYRGIREGNDSLGNWLGLLAAAMYGVHSLVSFQQVLNTPVLFLVLGLSEGMRRLQRHEKRQEQHDGKGEALWNAQGGKAE